MFLKVLSMVVAVLFGMTAILPAAPAHRAALAPKSGFSEQASRDAELKKKFASLLDRMDEEAAIGEMLALFAGNPELLMQLLVGELRHPRHWSSRGYVATAARRAMDKYAVKLRGNQMKALLEILTGDREMIETGARYFLDRKTVAEMEETVSAALSAHPALLSEFLATMAAARGGTQLYLARMLADEKNRGFKVENAEFEALLEIIASSDDAQQVSAPLSAFLAQAVAGNPALIASLFRAYQKAAGPVQWNLLDVMQKAMDADEKRRLFNQHTFDALVHDLEQSTHPLETRRLLRVVQQAILQYPSLDVGADKLFVIFRQRMRDNTVTDANAQSSRFIERFLARTNDMPLNRGVFLKFLGEVRRVRGNYAVIRQECWPMARVLGAALSRDPALVPFLFHAMKTAGSDEKLVLAFAAGVGVGRNPQLREPLLPLLRDHAGLLFIQFRDGGNSPNSASSFAEGLMSQIETLDLRTPPHSLANPVLPGPHADVPEFASSDELLKGHTLLRAQGRTLVYRTPDGKFLGLKIRREGEDPELLHHESGALDAFNAGRERLNLQGHYPSAKLVEGNRVFGVKDFGGEAEAQLRQNADERLQYALKKQFYALSTMYVAEDEKYFRYLNDPGLSLDAFRRASMTCLHDLFTLAGHGIVHTATLTLFHNVIQRGRQDRGRYVWMVDIIRPMAVRIGVGRLHAWPDAVQYPNPRVSGIGDLAEIRSMNQLLNPQSSMDNPSLTAHLDTLDDAHPEYKKDVFYLASYLGDYLLSWALLAGSYFREKGLLDWRDPRKVEFLADLMREGFERSFAAFTGRPPEWSSGLDSLVDWRRLARQMAFFMAKGDVPADYLLANDIPQEIYGLGRGGVMYSDDFKASRGWVETPERLGWYFGGVYPDLGPVSGPLPLQELIKAMYVYAAFMVADMGRPQAAVMPGPRQLEFDSPAGFSL